MILLLGVPQAATLLEAIRDALERRGQSCEIAHGVAPLIASGAWAQARIVLSVALPIGEAEMAAAPRLRAIISPLLGFDFIDVAAATRHGIMVANSEVAENRESIAEATIMLILVLLYRLHDSEAAMQAAPAGPIRRRMLRGKTVGVVGLGGISRAIIARLAGWECDIIVHSRRGGREDASLRFVELDALMAESDVILVMTSLNEDTYRLIDEQMLALAKPDALLVNTARGAIVDEDALVAALRDGRLGGAALDVFEVEPLPSDHALRTLDNVILTPHCVGHTEETFNALPVEAVENVLAAVNGLMPNSCKNPEVADRWSTRG